MYAREKKKGLPDSQMPIAQVPSSPHRVVQSLPTSSLMTTNSESGKNIYLQLLPPQTFPFPSVM